MIGFFENHMMPYDIRRSVSGILIHINDTTAHSKFTNFQEKKKVTNICLDPLPGYPVVLGQLFHPDPCPLVANLTGCHRPHTPFLSEHGPWCCRLVLQPPDLHIHPGLGQLRSVPCTVRETTKSALVSRLPH